MIWKTKTKGAIFKVPDGAKHFPAVAKGNMPELITWQPVESSMPLDSGCPLAQVRRRQLEGSKPEQNRGGVGRRGKQEGVV